jgi:hypothetical protein
MMNCLSAWVGFLAAGWLGSCCYGATQVRSVTDLDALKAQAHRTKRLVLLSVTSSDPGCWQCKRIGEQFLANRDFTEWVEQCAIVGELDIAARGRARDAMLSTVYAAHGAPVPGLLLLHPDGRRLSQAPHEGRSVSQSVAEFRTIYARELEGVTVDATASASHSSSSNLAATVVETRWNPPAAKPVHYSGLKLKNISGTGPRRFALINDQTLMVGETTKVMSDGARIGVTLLEAGRDSVRIQVQGEQEPRVLTFKAAN